MADVDLTPIRGIAEALTELLLQRGFWREPPWPTTVEGDETPHGIACSWLRALNIHPDDPGGEELLSQWGNCDGVSIWLDGHVNVHVASMSGQFRWRRTPLEPRDIAEAIDAYIGALDRRTPSGILEPAWVH